MRGIKYLRLMLSVHYAVVMLAIVEAQPLIYEDGGEAQAFAP
jgi:hypothetical protein